MRSLKFAAAALAATAISAPASAAITVSLPGSFNSELGCPGDWMPECAAAQMTKGSDGLWYAEFLLGAGDYEYKITHDESWNENYGMFGMRDGANLSLSLLTAGTVYFRYDEATHLATSQLTSFAAPAAVPEPATWAMMLLGFGGIGFAMRRRAQARLAVA